MVYIPNQMDTRTNSEHYTMPHFQDLKKSIQQLFTQHPHSVGETYTQHLQFASWSGFRLICAGVACMIHSIFPFIFPYTASSTIDKISKEMQDRKNHAHG